MILTEDQLSGNLWVVSGVGNLTAARVDWCRELTSQFDIFLST